MVVIINTMQPRGGIWQWKREMRAKGIEVVDIPPRIRRHNYTENTKKRKLEGEKNEKTARDDN